MRGLTSDRNTQRTIARIMPDHCQSYLYRGMRGMDDISDSSNIDYLRRQKHYGG